MGRNWASVRATGSLALFCVALTATDVRADPKNIVVEEDLARSREVVPLPPVPETMAVPTPAEAAEAAPAPAISPAPPPPSVTPRARRHHHKSTPPKPSEGMERP
jgi:hypothetical protein